MYKKSSRKVKIMAGIVRLRKGICLSALVSSGAMAQTFLCDLHQVRPLVITIDRSRMTVQAEYWGNTTSTHCIEEWVNETTGPVYKGQTAEYCSMFGGSNSPARQTVAIVGSDLEVGDSNGGGFSLNLKNGLFRGGGNGMVAECHRPHS